MTAAPQTGSDVTGYAMTYEMGRCQRKIVVKSANDTMLKRLVTGDMRNKS